MEKIAVISDIHDNILNLEKTLNYIIKQNIKHLVCTGDCQTMDVWDILENTPLKTYAVLGNADEHLFDEEKIKTYFKNISLFPLWGSFKIAGKNIIISHYINVLKEVIDKETKKYDLGLYGHSHKPWEESYNNTKLLNSGNVANIRYSPSFAIINIKNLEAQLILLNEI